MYYYATTTILYILCWVDVAPRFNHPVLRGAPNRLQPDHDIVAMCGHRILGLLGGAARLSAPPLTPVNRLPLLPPLLLLSWTMCACRLSHPLFTNAFFLCFAVADLAYSIMFFLSPT